MRFMNIKDEMSESTGKEKHKEFHMMCRSYEIYEITTILLHTHLFSYL